jgi:hypothetical protein
MIRVWLGPRLIKSARKLSPDLRAKVEAALTGVAEHFGEVHRHSGLGLRKLAKNSWECRVDLRWRIVFVEQADGLKAYDLMDHDEVRVWLKGQWR